MLSTGRSPSNADGMWMNICRGKSWGA